MAAHTHTYEECLQLQLILRYSAVFIVRSGIFQVVLKLVISFRGTCNYAPAVHRTHWQKPTEYHPLRRHGTTLGSKYRA